MANPPKIFLSPFVLSTVMFDNSNSLGDQEGFLIGSTQKSVRREISDQSMFNTEEDLLISVYSCIPCGDFMSFYDNAGSVNASKIEDFLGERCNHIVGWYRFRRNIVAYPSAREMRVHEELEKLFPGNLAFGAENFVFGVFGSSCFPTIATHTYDYAFFVQTTDCFRSLSINLLNLGDTKTEYRMDSISNAFVNSTTFDTVLSIPWDFGSCWQTEDVMQQMHKMLREKCDNLAEELTASESVNNCIEQEINILESELQRLTSKEPEASDDVVLSNMVSDNLYLPYTEKQTVYTGRRNINEFSYTEEEPHPLYGKYFPRNRPREPESEKKDTNISQENAEYPSAESAPTSSTNDDLSVQERSQLLDHDYSGASNEEVHQEITPENAAKNSSKASESADYVFEEEIQYSRIEDDPSSETSESASSPIAHQQLKLSEHRIKLELLDDTVPLVSNTTKDPGAAKMTDQIKITSNLKNNTPEKTVEKDDSCSEVSSTVPDHDLDDSSVGTDSKGKSHADCAVSCLSRKSHK